jgi:predicted metal-dependent HD superfamily phosphohydrolase
LVEAAIWYHDSVYDTHAKDNEERSADLALSSLKLRKKNAAILRELILDTKHVLPPKTIDGRVLVDIDLASLAALPENFALDGRNIRKEYSWVETDKFRDGRAIFLERLLERPTIYHTLMFRNAYEGRARQNLQQAVLELRLNSTGS